MAAFTSGRVFVAMGAIAGVCLIVAGAGGGFKFSQTSETDRRLQDPLFLPPAECAEGDWWCQTVPDSAKGYNPAKNWYQYLLNAAFAAIFAFIYKRQIVDKLGELDPVDNKNTLETWSDLGLFSCFGDCSTCLYVMCCPFSVSAKNFDRAGVMGFWPSCALLYVSYQCCCIGAIIRAHLVGQFKDSLGIPHSFISDCCLSCFCFQCETGRESMLVDEELGVEIKCLLKVVQKRDFMVNE